MALDTISRRVVGGCGIAVPDGGSVRFRPPDGPCEPVFSRAGEALALSVGRQPVEGTSVEVWAVLLTAVPSFATLLVLPHPGPVSDLAFCEQGEWLATACLPEGRDGSEIRVWHVPDGRLLGTWTRKRSVTRVRVLPGATRVLTRESDDGVRLWDTRHGNDVLRVVSGAQTPLVVRGWRLAATPAASVTFWDLDRLELLATFDNSAQALALGPRDTLAISGFFGEIVLTGLGAGRSAMILPAGPHALRVSRLELRASGELLLIDAARESRLIRTSDGSLVRTLPTLVHPRFSEDGELLLGYRGPDAVTVRVDTGEPVDAVPIRRSPGFCPDGSLVARLEPGRLEVVRMSDGTVRLVVEWQPEPQ